MDIVTSSIIIGIVIIASIIWAVFWGGRLPIPFVSRSCQGKSWRQSFPNTPKEEIRKFLLTFTYAFAFRDQEKLKLNPDDQLLDIYRALYPHKWQADALEFETLSAVLKKEYSVEFDQIWHDGLTLGQLFGYLQKAEITENNIQRN